MESLLEEIAISHIYGAMVIFLRIGSMFMTIPGIGESYVAIRIRLFFSIIISLLIYPIVTKYIPTLPKDVPSLFIIMLIEIVTGIFYGMLIRILLNILQIAGLIVAVQSGLGSALFFDPNQGSQGAIVGTFYSSLALTLFFSADTYGFLIKGIIESFQTLPPGDFFAFEDFISAVIKTIDQSFLIAFKISSPIMIIALLVLIGAGILSRLMPGIQVFFILTPIQILISFYVILFTLSGTLIWYLDSIIVMLSNFFVGV